MEPVSLGTRPLVMSWINSIPENIKNKTQIVQTMTHLFDTYLDELIHYMRHNCKEIIPTMDNNITQSACRIINCFIDQYIESEIKKVP